MSNQITLKRFRRVALLALVVLIGLYFAPFVVLFYFICGAIDVSRHHHINYDLIEKYFMGNGIPTWLLSPLNLLADLLSHKNTGVYRVEDLPASHRDEIQACVAAFRQNGDLIKDRVAKTLGDSKRGMLTFKWFGTPQVNELKIPEFERDYRYIKTVAVSVFNTKERTSWHFGPMRLTFRVLCNLEPVNSREVHLDVDGQSYYWIDEPLIVFDDTFFHRSINDVDQIRYCLFMDIIRPNYFEASFNVALSFVAFISSSMKAMFYKNWSFIR